MGVFRLTVACIVGKVSTYFCKVWIFCSTTVSVPDDVCI